jgi:iron(III) transport system ATP-binding protein
LRLDRAKPASINGLAAVEVQVLERAYLGEYWNYLVAPREGSTKLRVTTPPLDVYGVGDTAWLALDPKQMAPIV